MTTTPYYEDKHATVHHGDCVKVLAGMPDNHFDAVITDPPYALSFMSRSWDGWDTPAAFQAWCETWAAECLRVLKPGGYMLAFGGTRTWHRLVCAIEDAGFEIRDSVAWLYGSGFPKSLDVSKQIDKAAPRVGMFSEFAAYLRERRTALGITQKEIAAHFLSKTGGMTGCVWNWENGANVPTRVQWQVLAAILDIPYGMWAPLIDRIEADREIVGAKEAGMGTGKTFGMLQSEGSNGDATHNIDVTAPATAEAAQWAGYGTAMKPGHEPICVARKPLSEGTVAGNVLKWGTGAVNIDAMRIPSKRITTTNGSVNEIYGDLSYTAGQSWESHAGGRWPANVALDGETATNLDQQTGETTSPPIGSVARTKGGNTIGTFAYEGRPPSPNGHGDSGGASRFFFVARSEGGTIRKVCETANTAEENLSPPSELGGSAPSGAATSGSHEDNSKRPEKAPSTSDTATESRPSGDSDTPLIPNTDARFSPESKPLRLTPTSNPASDAGTSGPTVTTTTTTNPSTSGGSAEPATSSTTPNFREPGAAALPIDTLGSRFFYTSKAPSDERIAINGVSHVTVKPLDLMQWLIRGYAGPKGALILDPFAGSGTTGEAAIAEGMRAVLIEQDATYLPLIKARVTRRTDPVEHLRTVGEDLGLFGLDDVVG